MLVLIFGELGLVIALSAAIGRLQSSTALFMFFAYSFLNGLTLSTIFLVYTKASIASTFFITAGTFAAMSVYGYTTKRDLTSMGSFLMMGLIGIIIASFVNFFFRQPCFLLAHNLCGHSHFCRAYRLRCPEDKGNGLCRICRVRR